MDKPRLEVLQTLGKEILNHLEDENPIVCCDLTCQKLDNCVIYLLEQEFPFSDNDISARMQLVYSETCPCPPNSGVPKLYVYCDNSFTWVTPGELVCSNLPNCGQYRHENFMRHECECLVSWSIVEGQKSGDTEDFETKLLNAAPKLELFWEVCATYLKENLAMLETMQKERYPGV